MLFTASTNTGNFMFVVKMVYVDLDWFVYEDTDILRMLRMAREHVYHSVHMPLLSTTT